MQNKPFSVKITLGFILFNAILLFGLGILILLDQIPGLTGFTWLRWGFMGTSLLGGVFLVLMVFFLGKSHKVAFYLTIAFLAFEILLAVFDQFGWIDLAVVVINLCPIILMAIDRKWYLDKSTSRGS